MMILEWDYKVLLFIQEHLRFEILTPFWELITRLGDAGIIWIALTLFLLCNQKTRRYGLAFTIALCSGLLIANLGLKNMFCRMRPYDAHADLILIGRILHDYSFPSGHTTASFACAFLGMRLFEKKYSLPMLILACLIAFSRLYLGCHYLTDILGGIAVGFLAAVIGNIFYQRYLKEKS